MLLLLLFLLLSYSASTRICLLWSARKEFGHETVLKSQMYRIAQGTPANKVAKRFQINRRQLSGIWARIVRKKITRHGWDKPTKLFFKKWKLDSLIWIAKQNYCWSKWISFVNFSLQQFSAKRTKKATVLRDGKSNQKLHWKEETCYGTDRWWYKDKNTNTW